MLLSHGAAGAERHRLPPALSIRMVRGGILGVMILWGVALVGCLVATVLWRRRSWAWTVPLAGLGVVAAGAVIAMVMTDYAMTIA